VDFADYLMFHRHQDGTLLDTFRLHVDSTNQARPADAARWVRRALKCSPRVLHIHSSLLQEYNYRRIEIRVLVWLRHDLVSRLSGVSDSSSCWTSPATKSELRPMWRVATITYMGRSGYEGFR
jgi:hypothetical protein